MEAIILLWFQKRFRITNWVFTFVLLFLHPRTTWKSTQQLLFYWVFAALSQSSFYWSRHFCCIFSVFLLNNERKKQIYHLRIKLTQVKFKLVKINLERTKLTFRFRNFHALYQNSLTVDISRRHLQFFLCINCRTKLIFNLSNQIKNSW